MDFTLDDRLLSNAKILTYGMDCQFKNKHNKVVPYNPKTCPNVGVIVLIPLDGVFCQIYFNPIKQAWCGFLKDQSEKITLSPEQFEQFFSTVFFKKLLATLRAFWPLKDPFHRNLYRSLCEKHIEQELTEDKLVKDCDGATGTGLVSPATSSPGIEVSDVLGNCDHEKGEGFFGKDCFHLPSGILKNPLKRFSNKKNKKTQIFQY